MGTSAALVFPEGDDLVAFYLYVSGGPPSWEAEADIFQTMLASFSLGPKPSVSDFVLPEGAWCESYEPVGWAFRVIREDEFCFGLVVKSVTGEESREQVSRARQWAEQRVRELIENKAFTTHSFAGSSLMPSPQTDVHDRKITGYNRRVGLNYLLQHTNARPR